MIALAALATASADPVAPPADAPAPAEPTPAEPTPPDPAPAEPTPPDPAPAQEEGPVQEEVVVYGRLAVEKARDAVVHDVEALGWRARSWEEDRVVLRSGDWRGAVVVHDDGRITFSRALAGLGEPPPQLFDGDPARVGGPDPARPGMNTGGVTLWTRPSDRRVAAAQAEVLAATEAHRAALRQVFDRTVEAELLAGLPERLGAMTREEVLTYWARQPDDPFGDRVTAAVERWMGAAWAEAPVTEAERLRHEPARADGRRLPGDG